MQKSLSYFGVSRSPDRKTYTNGMLLSLQILGQPDSNPRGHENESDDREHVSDWWYFITHTLRFRAEI